RVEVVDALEVGRGVQRLDHDALGGVPDAAVGVLALQLRGRLLAPAREVRAPRGARTVGGVVAHRPEAYGEGCPTGKPGGAPAAVRRRRPPRAPGGRRPP